MSIVRSQGGLVVLILALAAASWWSTLERMHGMDAGPWTALGSLGWFLGVWIVMMAAMMLPSAIPTVATYARLAGDRTPLGPLFFAAGYLTVWAAAGVVAFALGTAGGQVSHGDHTARLAAGATLLLAAVYQLTPFKDACLGRCRNPLAFVLGSWRPGLRGALRMGTESGAWCTGCCWALMASLFALGIMNVAWMALVAGLVALERILPWRRLATATTTALLVVLGVLVLAGG